MIQRVQDKFLVPLDSLLEDTDREVFPRAVGDEDITWAVQVASVVACQIGHVSAVVDSDRVEIYATC